MTFPVATYRIQLHRGFGFSDAARIAEYIGALGASHFYLSPVMESVPGSLHGYDCTDFARVSAERGGEEGFRTLLQSLGSLRLILDFVPNHMAASPLNPYWRDVLAKGRESPYWRLFDLHPGEKIRLPVLEKDLDTLAAEGHCAIVATPDGQAFRYRETLFPLNEKSQAAAAAGTARLGDVMEMQHYALEDWRTATGCSYRRFFNIVDLVGLRVEDADVFTLVHAKLLKFLREHMAIDGLRIDHIDGLARPGEYLERLSAVGKNIWVEKILARGEEMPRTWKACGTTGYEFIDRMNRLQTNAEGFAEIEGWWRQQTCPAWKGFDDCVYRSKLEVLEDTFAPELDRLAEILAPGGDRNEAREFIAAVTAALPVYRTYDDGEDGAAIIAAAAERAVRLNPKLAAAKAKYLDAFAGEAFATPWRQLSGAAMAKGLEDRAHYRYTPLAALNEVGCVADFKAEAAFPLPGAGNLSFSASTTHDTKRSEDVRARLIALCDTPLRWLSFCEWTLPRKPKEVPPAACLFILQAVIGTLPLQDDIDEDYRQRLRQYVQKAAREEALKTSWRKPDEAYEEQLRSFVDTLLSDPAFTAEARKLLEWLAPAGAINSLSAQALKIISPGVPDIYQGTEFWDFSLVDPDNRRPVDYARGIRMLKETREESPAQLARRWQDGGIKLWLTHRLLEVRRQHFSAPEDIRSFTPLPASGTRKANLFACALELAGGRILAIMPRFPGQLPLQNGSLLYAQDAWGDTRVEFPSGIAQTTCLLTGGHRKGNSNTAADLFSGFPLAVLLAE